MLACALLSSAQQTTTKYSALPGLAGARAAQKDALNAEASGAPRQAYWLATEALRLAQSKLATNDPQIAIFHYDLGRYALQLGLYEISHAQMQIALAGYKPGNENRPPVLQTLANIDTLRELPEEALAHARDALAASAALRGPAADIARVEALEQLGRLLNRTGKFAEADAALNEAIDGLQNSPLRSVVLPAVLEDAAGVDISLKRYEAATKRLVMARSLLGSGSVSATTLTTGIDAELATVQAALGDTNAAVATLSRSFDLSSRILRSSLSSDSSDPRIIDLLRQMADQLDAAVTLDETYGDGSAAMRQLAVIATASRVGLAQDLTAQLARLLRVEAVGDDAARFRRMIELRSELAAVIRARWRSGSGYEDRLRALESESRNIERDLLQKHPSVIGELAAPDVAAIGSQLDENTVILLFVRFQRLEGTRAYRVYIIQRGKPVAAKTLGDSDRIDEAARQFRDSLEKPSSIDPQQRLDRARALATLVWDPIEKWVRGAKRLVIVPDDELSLVSFSALVDSNKVFVGAERSVTYVSGVRQLARPTPAAATAGAAPPVILADPDYGGDGAGPWTPVTETAPLPDYIRKWRPDAVPRTRADASTRTARLVVSPGFLHIASHAFFENVPDQMGGLVEDTIEPMLTGGIALAGANRPNSVADGILSPLEIAGMDLRGTELVFISGCSTAQGVTRAHEGLYGIRRALETAGSGAQILALWDIDRTATMEFVNDFYARWLGQELPVEQAFFEAQKHVRHFKPAWNDPFYWAGFVLSGQAADQQSKLSAEPQ
jgi:CHAT domain-containing protein